jgi:hypothetical protein
LPDAFHRDLLTSYETGNRKPARRPFVCARLGPLPCSARRRSFLGINFLTNDDGLSGGSGSLRSIPSFRAASI